LERDAGADIRVANEPPRGAESLTPQPPKTAQVWDDASVKHLEFIQAVIARQAQNGSISKGWAVTIAGVFFAFAVQSRNPLLALTSLVPTLIFWGLDAYFLYCERQFRRLFERVRNKDPEVGPFFMNATERGPEIRLRHRIVDWSGTLTRFPILITYVGLSCAAVAIAAVLYFGNGGQTGATRPVSSATPMVESQPQPSSVGSQGSAVPTSSAAGPVDSSAHHP
jgi:hypothetical protein